MDAHFHWKNQQWEGRQKVERGEEEIPEDVDFMTFMILSGKMNKQELAMCANDMIGAGVETVSYSS